MKLIFTLKTTASQALIPLLAICLPYVCQFISEHPKKPPFPFHPHPLTLKTLILIHLSVQYLALEENTLHPHLFMVPLPLPDEGYRRTVATPILSLPRGSAGSNSLKGLNG